jgi:hypothetical protein
MRFLMERIYEIMAYIVDKYQIEPEDQDKIQAALEGSDDLEFGEEYVEEDEEYDEDEE